MLGNAYDINPHRVQTASMYFYIVLHISIQSKKIRAFSRIPFVGSISRIVFNTL